MPFDLEDFPIKTNRPRIDVTLPVGRHEFELVVVDSAGLRSAPDRIVVVVEEAVAYKPVIKGIDKVFGLPGEKFETYVRGENLAEASDIRFEPATDEGGREERGPGAKERSASAAARQIEATILKGGTANQLRVELRIGAKAALGEYRFSVTTRGGTAASPVHFLVTAPPQIDSIGPASAHAGEDIEMTIEGSYLWIDRLPGFDEPAVVGMHGVEVVPEEGAGPVPEITTKILEKRSKSESVCVEIHVGANVATGDYRIRLTTPAGEAYASETFLVERDRGRR